MSPISEAIDSESPITNLCSSSVLLARTAGASMHKLCIYIDPHERGIDVCGLYTREAIDSVGGCVRGGGGCSCLKDKKKSETESFGPGRPEIQLHPNPRVDHPRHLIPRDGQDIHTHRFEVRDEVGGGQAGGLQFGFGRRR